MVHGGKILSNVHSNQDFPETGDHSRVGPSPNQCGPPVRRKLKSEMLSLARASKYVNNTSVWKYQQLRGGQFGRIRVVSSTFAFAPESFRPFSLSPGVVSPPGSFRPLSRSPLSRFAHFPVRPRVVSPPYKILFLVLLFRPQKWYKALIFWLIGDFSL